MSSTPSIHTGGVHAESGSTNLSANTPARTPTRTLARTSARALARAVCVCVALAFANALPLVPQTVLAAETVHATQAVDVGAVSLVLGRAYVERGVERGVERTVERGDGQQGANQKASRQRLQAGDAVRVGDRLYTEAGGHVHVRFIDDALVSVRPSSTLDILRYDYNANRPADSAVKFELSEGVARAISGEAAKSARERFRLNTPIAAIGVRGTDFVVSADALSTRALVNEGSIVVAPFSSECSVDALGPCAADAVELTQNTLQAVEVNQLATTPQLVASASARVRTALRGSDQQAASAEVASGDLAATETQPAADTADSTDVYVESVANDKVVVAETTAATAAEQRAIDFTPAVALSAATTADSQLVWGRWADADAGDDLLSIASSDARQDRKPTVSNLNGSILYRSEPNGARIDSTLSQVSFDLSAAQAFFDSASGRFAMRVGGGELSLDFIERSFNTALSLDHEATGAIGFAAAGSIIDGGYLRLRSDSQNVLGAVSTDGAEASYYFDQQLSNGTISGTTVWGAK